MQVGEALAQPELPKSHVFEELERHAFRERPKPSIRECDVAVRSFKAVETSVLAGMQPVSNESSQSECKNRSFDRRLAQRFRSSRCSPTAELLIDVITQLSDLAVHVTELVRAVP